MVILWGWVFLMGEVPAARSTAPAVHAAFLLLDGAQAAWSARHGQTSSSPSFSGLDFQLPIRFPAPHHLRAWEGAAGTHHQDCT